MTGGLFLRVPSAPVENRQLTLDLQTENKGSIVSGGELTIFLDGPAVALGSVPDGSAGTEGECPARSGSGAGRARPRHPRAGVPGPAPASAPVRALPSPAPAPWAPTGASVGQEQNGIVDGLTAAWEERPFPSPPPAFHAGQPLPLLDRPLPSLPVRAGEMVSVSADPLTESFPSRACVGSQAGGSSLGVARGAKLVQIRGWCIAFP